MRSRHATVVAIALTGALMLVSATASAHPDSSELDDGVNEGGETTLELPWGDGHSDVHDEPTGNPGLPDTLGATGSKTLDVVGRGIRNASGVTTDVWAHDGYAYTGTFSTECSTGDNDSGIWIWDTSNVNKVKFVGVIDSAAGSKANDVRVAGMNSGDILVLSNESCAGGPGGFDIYNVDDPANPVFEARVQIDELNAIADSLFGGVTDVGVHNLWLFTDGANDYVGVTSEGVFDNFRIYDITDPSSPALASAWGAEELFDAGVGDSDDFDRVLDAALYLLDGVGASANKFLHDVTITADGNTAYLANWDAGLVALDISDPTVEPTVISVAIDPAGSLDGEVNSHSVWPSEDGSIVIEGEEDFSAWEANVPPTGITADGTATPGDPTIPVTAIATSAGDFFADPANQTGLAGTVHGASISVDGGPEFDAAEMGTAAGSPTLADTGDISGNIVYVGRACGLTTGDVLENPLSAGDIAVVRRGACEFDEKAQTVAAAGASVAVIANNNPVSTEWSGMRIWDYSDPANPVLASTFNTTCSASTEPSSSCVSGGTYSAHNVVVETQGNKVLAYIAWYNDGMIVLDISDPYAPVEVARYLGTNEDGELNDFWGVYKIANDPFIYASDRNGGLYIFKMKGKGLQKRN